MVGKGIYVHVAGSDQCVCTNERALNYTSVYIIQYRFRIMKRVEL